MTAPKEMRCPQILDFDRLSANDNIVLVVGPTGSGKSSFIEMATGVTGLVGHSLKSYTRGISIIKGSFLELVSSDIYFVDTPGLDDEERSEMDIFKELSSWLIKAHKKRLRFRGVLYFHRISDVRMAGTPLQNLRNLEQLCGNDFYRIVLTTTMWDTVTEEKGNAREEELREYFWQSMMERGSAIRRFRRSRNSVIDVLSPLFNAAVTAREILPRDLSEHDNVIALMGPTGSGKSSFLEIITGIDGLVSHGLESSSDEISIVKFSCPEFLNSDVCFVDTPGFDNSNKSHLDIFKLISEWFYGTYKRKIQLTGMLYFHRISDNRMSGTPLQNLRFFESLCGKTFNNIVLTTTMWDQVGEEEGSNREKELKDVFWKTMIARGSTVKRFRRTRTSAFKVLEPIFEEIDRKGVLLLQKEMIDLGLHLNQTTAGRTLFEELEKTVASHRSALENFRRNSSKFAFNEDERKELEQEKEKVAKDLKRALDDKQQLKISLLQKLLLTSPFPRSWVLSRPIFWKSKRTKKVSSPTTNPKQEEPVSRATNDTTPDKILSASPTDRDEKSNELLLKGKEVVQDENCSTSSADRDKESGGDALLKGKELADEPQTTSDENHNIRPTVHDKKSDAYASKAMEDEKHSTSSTEQAKQPDEQPLKGLEIADEQAIRGGGPGVGSFDEYMLMCMEIADGQALAGDSK